MNKRKGPKPVRGWAVPINGKISPMLLGETRRRAETFSTMHAANMTERTKQVHLIGEAIRVTITPDPPRSRK